VLWRHESHLPQQLSEDTPSLLQLLLRLHRQLTHTRIDLAQLSPNTPALPPTPLFSYRSLRRSPFPCAIAACDSFSASLWGSRYATIPPHPPLLGLAPNHHFAPRSCTVR
jgi:hypothetical protein